MACQNYIVKLHLSNTLHEQMNEMKLKKKENGTKTLSNTDVNSQLQMKFT